MSNSDQDEFDGYHKWLGISSQNRLPTHYELLAVSVDETDDDVIRAAAEQRRAFVESKRGQGRDSIVTEILYRINEAEVTLLSNSMRRDYDRKMDLFDKRRKDRQIDPDATATRKIRHDAVTSGDEWVANTFAGTIAIVCVAFGAILWISFRMPWSQRSKPAEAAVAAQAPAQRSPVFELSKPAAAEPVAMDEKFLDDWDLFPPDGKSTWSVKGGVLRHAGKGPSLVSKKSFDDFDLSLEFKLPAKYNGSVWFRGCELKLVDSESRTKKGEPIPVISGCGAINGQVAPMATPYKGPDKWNAFVVRTVGTVVTVWLNDVVVVDSHKFKSLKTADAPDPSKIMLQAGEVGGVEFRGIAITPINDGTIKDMVRIQGDWQCVATDLDGKPFDETVVRREDFRINFAGTTLTSRRTVGGSRKIWNGTFALDGPKSRFSLNETGEDDAPIGRNATYEMGNDSLKLRYQVTSGPSASEISYSLKRIDPERPNGFLETTQRRLVGTKWNNSALEAFEWSDDGKLLINGAEREWTILSGREVQIILDADRVDTLVFNETFTEFEQFVKGGPQSLTGYKRGTNVQGLVRKFQGHEGEVSTISFSPDGLRAVSSGDKSVRCWDVSSGKQLWSCDDFTANVRFAKYLPGGRRVIASAANRCSILDADTGKSIVNTGKSDVFAISDDCRLLAIRKKGNTGLIYDLEQHKETRKFSTSVGANAGTFTADNSALVFGAAQLDRLDLSTGRQTARYIVQPTNTVIATAEFSPSGELLATGSHMETFLDRGQSMGDRTIRLWNVRTGKLERELKDHREFIYSVAFTPNGKRLLSAGGGTLQNLKGIGGLADRSIRLWDVETGRVLRTFDGHQGAVHVLRISPDGRFFLSGGADKTMILWQLPE